MAGKEHTFIIEIPADLQLNEEERAALEGHFQVDAGNLLDERDGINPDDPFTNRSAVQVITRVQSASTSLAGETTDEGGGGALDTY